MIQTEKIDISGEKDALISIVAKMIETQRQPPEYEHWVETDFTLYLFFVVSLSCSFYLANVIKKTELLLLAVLILRKVRLSPSKKGGFIIGSPSYERSYKITVVYLSVRPSVRRFSQIWNNNFFWFLEDDNW